MEKQKRNMFLSAEEIDAKEKPLITVVYDYFVMAMVLYFVITFLNEIVRKYLKDNMHKQR